MNVLLLFFAISGQNARHAWNTAGQSSRLQEKIGRKQNGTRAAAKAVRVPEDQLVFNSFSALR
ncbi:MAG: hypothetical protein ACLR5F_06115 [Faecalibacterium sp.]